MCLETLNPGWPGGARPSAPLTGRRRGFGRELPLDLYPLQVLENAEEAGTSQVTIDANDTPGQRVTFPRTDSPSTVCIPINCN
jgi:hypothetical protein